MHVARPGEHAARVRGRRRTTMYTFGGAITAGAVGRRGFATSSARTTMADAARTRSGIDAHDLLEAEALTHASRAAKACCSAAVPDGRTQSDLGRQGERRLRGPDALSQARPFVSRGAGGRDVRAAAQHRGGHPERRAARRTAGCRRWRGAFRPVDADHRRRNGKAGVHHRAGRRSRDGRGIARSLWRRSCLQRRRHGAAG